MTRVHEGLADTGFPIPDSVETAQVCRKSGMLPSPGVCELDARGSAVYTEYFAVGTVPTEVCSNHVLGTVCAESGGTPTEFCPQESRINRAFMVLPPNETGGTDDSNYVQPGPCPIHTAAVPEETIPEQSDGLAPVVPFDPSLGPGYLGPGYTGPGYTSPGYSEPGYSEPGYIYPR